MNMITIEDSLLGRFHHLASETQRPETDIIVNQCLSEIL